VELSVVIITFNEERNIARCLASVKEVADEVVVVDSGSTDGTVRIAKEHGALVTHRAWTNYSAQKNFANDLAASRYILSLDADEALSEELRNAILQEKRTGFQGAYSMARLTNYCGTWVRHGGWYPDIKLRVFPLGRARWVGEHVHETLELVGDMPVTLLVGDLLHFSYPSIADHEERIERYSTLHAQGMKARGIRPNMFKRWFSPAFKFVQGYLFQMGLLDGRAGWHIARLSARAVRLKYAKLKAAWEQG